MLIGHLEGFNRLFLTFGRDGEGGEDEGEEGGDGQEDAVCRFTFDLLHREHRSDHDYTCH